MGLDDWGLTMDDWIERKDTRCTAMQRNGYRERKRTTKKTVFRERIGVREEEKGQIWMLGPFMLFLFDLF